MIELYLGSELTESELRESLNFSDTDIQIANQTQVDFVLICEPGLKEIPYDIRRQFRCEYTVNYGTFRGISKTIFIIWH